MKRFIYCTILFFIFITISCIENDENNYEELNDKKARIDGDVKIAYWYKGNSLALSFTWDDSLEKQFTSVAPIFDKYGYKASFFPYTDNYFKKKFVNGYRKIALNGHEIGSHTVNHKDLTSLPLSLVEYELSESKKILFDSLNVNPVSFIHPFNVRNESVNKLVLKYFAFSRYASSVSMDNRVIYTLMSNWKASDGVELIKKFSNKQKWLILAGHSVDGDGYQPMDSNALNQLLFSVKNLQPYKVWVAKFYEVALYDELRQLVRISDIYNNVISIDDSKVNKTHYANLGISNLFITIQVPVIKRYVIQGFDIIDIVKHDNYNFLTIDLMQYKTIDETI